MIDRAFVRIEAKEGKEDAVESFLTDALAAHLAGAPVPDPGRGVDQVGADGRGLGPGVPAAGGDADSGGAPAPTSPRSRP